LHFRGICLENRIIDPLWGELYIRLPVNPGNSIKGNGIFVKDIGFSKIVGVKIQESSPTFLTHLFSIRNSLDKKIKRQIPGDIGKICSAITLGIRESLTPEIYKRFQSCGATHLLAVSGLHTGIVFAVIFLLLTALQLKRNHALFISEIFVLIYAIFTGLRLPTLRASIMLLFFAIGEIRERNMDPLNILSSAAIFIILLMPRSIFGISFQLSFVAVFSILIMFNLLKDYFEKIPNKWFKRWLILPFFITLSAQLGTMPLVAYYFGYIPLTGLIANLILIPLTGTLISGCFLFFVLPFSNNIIGNFLWITGFSMNKIMIMIEKIPCSVIEIKKNQPIILFLYILYIIPLSLYVYRKTKKL
jgi:competence protein ComEC